MNNITLKTRLECQELIVKNIEQGKKKHVNEKQI
jgi:hypothetical protein